MCAFRTFLNFSVRFRCLSKPFRTSRNGLKCKSFCFYYTKTVVNLLHSNRSRPASSGQQFDQCSGSAYDRSFWPEPSLRTHNQLFKEIFRPSLLFLNQSAASTGAYSGERNAARPTGWWPALELAERHTHASPALRFSRSSTSRRPDSRRDSTLVPH